MKTAAMNLRVNVLGAKGVGKSAITVRYLTKRFIGEYSSGLDISYQTTFTQEDTPFKVDIMDTSSQEDCRASCHDRYDADAFVVVYSVTDDGSFQVAEKEIDTIRSRTSVNGPILLLGNKLDLDHARKVTHNDVERLLAAHECRHAEVSAAESYVLIVNSLQDLVAEAVKGLRLRGRMLKRRKSLFENVSRKLGSVFRRKSLEESPPTTKKKVARISHDNVNRRSV